METRLIISLVMLFGGILLIIIVSFCLKFVRMKRDNIKSSNEVSYNIINIIKTNNTYDKLLDVLVDLDDNLKEQGMTLNVDFKGYINNE